MDTTAAVQEAAAKDLAQIEAMAHYSAKTWRRTPEEEEAWVFGGGSGIPSAVDGFSGGTGHHPIAHGEARNIYMAAFRSA